MSSFYGNIVIGGGSGGTTNYNELENKPIINMDGSVTPIDFSALGVGHYSIKGKYRYTSESDYAIWTYPNEIFAFRDTVTNNLIVRFDVYEDDKRFTDTLIYQNDGTYEYKRYAYDIVATELKSELPEEGEINKIYATDEGIFVYVNGDYQQLGAGEEQSWSPIN